MVMSLGWREGGVVVLRCYSVAERLSDCEREEGGGGGVFVTGWPGINAMV